MATLPPRLIIGLAWKAHRALFRYSGGRLGLREATAEQEGLAQLATIGRKSGEKRVVMIAYYKDGDDFITLAMNGWDNADPAWWLNMQANSQAELITRQGRLSIAGREAEPGDEHDRLWDRWRKLDKSIDRFSHLRSNTPVVVLTPVDHGSQLSHFDH